MDLALHRRAFTEQERARLLERARAVLARNSGVASAWLLGSVARGESARDVDVAVLPRQGVDPWALADRLALLLEAEAPAGLPYDVRPVTRDTPPGFRYEVARTGILLADRDRDARVMFCAEAARDYLDLAPLLTRSRRAVIRRLARGA